jgi:charged multivesicular body protein 4
MNLFGRAKKAPPTTKDSITQLRETGETLEKRERHLQSKIDNEIKIAKENMHKNKKSIFFMVL